MRKIFVVFCPGLEAQEALKRLNVLNPNVPANLNGDRLVVSYPDNNLAVSSTIVNYGCDTSDIPLVVVVPQANREHMCELLVRWAASATQGTAIGHEYVKLQG